MITNRSAYAAAGLSGSAIPFRHISREVLYDPRYERLQLYLAIQTRVNPTLHGTPVRERGEVGYAGDLVVGQAFQPFIERKRGRLESPPYIRIC